MNKMKRRTAAGITAILVLAMTLGGCGSAAKTETAQEESAVTVSTTRVETGTITLTNSFVGMVSPQETVMVIPLTAGIVTDTFFEVGDEVRAGDVLFKIDDEAARLQYQTAQLNVENAKLTADTTVDNLIDQRDTTMDNLIDQRDTTMQDLADKQASTMENLANQQESTDLQLRSSRLQAQSSFEAAQIAYVSAKDNYERLNKAYNDAKKQYEDAAKAQESLKKELESAQRKEDEISRARAASGTAEEAEADGSESGGVSGDDVQKRTKDSLSVESSESRAADAGLGAIQEQIAALEGKIASLEGSMSTSSLSSLESTRNQAYQAYLSARSGYDAARKALDLAAETDAMTREQLDETINTTQDQLNRSILTTQEQLEKSINTTQNQLDKSIKSTKEQVALGIDIAQLSAAQAELALDYYTVTAPVSGVIESKGVDVNGVASQSSPAYTIVNNNTMTVTFQVSEDVRNTLSVGQRVTVDRNNRIYAATVTEVGASVNPQSGLFQIKACAEAGSVELPNGVSVKVSADTFRAENTMIIPYGAVYYENTGAYVYVSVNGRAVKTPITTGIFDDENIVVTGGLNLGDIVVTSWSPQLTDGVLLRAAE